MQKQSGIFQKWFTNFSMAVFSQTIHAVMMVALLKILSSISIQNAGESGDEGYYKGLVVSIVACVCVSGITRFEKVLKDLFGLQQSALLGDTRGNMGKTMMGIRSATDMGKNLYAPIKKGQEARKTVRQLQSKMDRYAQEGKVTMSDPDRKGNRYAALNYAPTQPDANQETTNNVNINIDSSQAVAKTVSNNQNLDSLIQTIATSQASTANSQVSTQGVRGNVSAGVPTTGVNSGNGIRLNDSTPNTNVSSPPNLTARQKEIEDWKYQKMQNEKSDQQSKIQADIDKYNEAVRQSKIANKDAFLNMVGTVAGVGVAAGAFDELSEIATAGNFISKPINDKSTQILTSKENRNIQDHTYNVASKTLSDTEIKQNVKISPQFVNDPSALEKFSSTLDKARTGIENKMQENTDKYGTVKGTVKTALDIAVSVDPATRGAKQAVQTIKNTSGHTLDTIKMVYNGNYRSNNTKFSTTDVSNI